MKVSFDMTEAVALAGRLTRAVTKVRPEKTTKHFGQMLLARTRAKASGRPGPNVITGQYRNSIRVRYETDPATGASTATVYSDAPQARRLEFGFKGTDSIGRSFNQPPRPHFGPAFDEVDRLYTGAAERLGVEALDTTIRGDL